VREAEGWANMRKEEDPTDVWLWVQVRQFALLSLWLLHLGLLLSALTEVRFLFAYFLLWRQTVDAFCLRYLLGDEGVELESVVSSYRQQFAFGASQRVKSSVMDQLSFLEEVLQVSCWCQCMLRFRNLHVVFVLFVGTSQRS
jgi:uncharacterized membrane protein YbaN (DUF454 family)